jgi:putative membrane protein
MPAADEGARAAPAKRAGSGRGWLLALGVCVLVATLSTVDVHGLTSALLQARFGFFGVVAAHLFVTLTAAIGWLVLLPAAQRPRLRTAFRLRLIKESVNGLLPVAQVGGDVVRARLAAGPKLSLRTSAASCLVDVILSLACLAIFILAGLAAAAAILTDPLLDRLTLQLAIAGSVVVLCVVAAERVGVLNLVDRVTAKSEGALGRLSGVGAEVKAITTRRKGILASVAWHLAAWGVGAVETWIALHAIGIDASFGEAFVLESLAQGARAIGFAVPGALGVQEVGYQLIGSALGIPREEATALSLIRRLRELVLGLAGLSLWRFRTPPLAEDEAATPDARSPEADQISARG